MIIRGKVTLEITMKSIDECQVAVSSLLPDEKELPPGLLSMIKCIDGKLIYEVTYNVESDRILSVYNTIDDFIRSLRVVMESLNKLGR
ncbi:KEOPS complex subunit Pcc1 [Vulcanisaeta distributa]|uniref:KEOPS complex subunit Pcc1 n=1 Tax=Vulcanisaeta distributa TaxID=164451 RepID=UPI0006D10C27|nr:KEOPS complex subunit Pcc1 [Vulcanisaeta distributa]